MATQPLTPHTPGLLTSRTVQSYNKKSIKIPIEKVSITRLRLSTDLYLLEQGDVLQLLSSFPKFASLKRSEEAFKDRRKKNT